MKFLELLTVLAKFMVAMLQLTLTPNMIQS